MKPFLLTALAASALTAQDVTGPVLGFVVDAQAALHPLVGIPSSAHIGAPVREDVRESWGSLALLTDGTALKNGQPLPGHWAALLPGAFLDESGRELLIVGETVEPWRLTIPDRALSVRVSISGAQVLTLLADESLASWSSSGAAGSRIQASQWWAIAFAGERPLAYDPAANALLWLDGPSGTTLARQLPGEGAQYLLAATRDGLSAVLLGTQLHIIPFDDGEIRSFSPPPGAQRLEPLHGGQSFLLTREVSRPLWVLQPSAKEPLHVIPALTAGGEK